MATPPRTSCCQLAAAVDTAHAQNGDSLLTVDRAAKLWQQHGTEENGPWCFQLRCIGQGDLPPTRTGVLATAAQLVQQRSAPLLAAQDRRAYLSLHRGQGCHFRQPRLFLLRSLLILEKAYGLGYCNNPHCLVCRPFSLKCSPPGLLRSRSLDQPCLFIFCRRLVSCCPFLLQRTFYKCCWGGTKQGQAAFLKQLWGQAPQAQG